VTARASLLPADFLLSVVMPVYNEKERIEEALAGVLAAPFRKEVIVVDDGSTDGTREVLARLARPEVRVVLHEANRGKGAALRTGMAHARGDVILIQDADLEYDPQEYPVLLAPIIDGKADVVFGSRFAGHGAHRVVYFWHSMGNRFLTLLSNMMTNLNLTDMETCYKVFTRQALSGIHLVQDRFGFEPEITAKISKRRLRIYEVPISYYGRTYEEGKKIGWKDGVNALWCIVRYNLFPGVTRGHGLLESWLGNIRARRIEGIFPPSSLDGAVLDIGCGSFPVFLWKSRFAQRTGIDRAYPQETSFWTVRGPIRVVPFDLESPGPLPFPDGSFQAVTMLAVAEHLERETLRRTLSEAFRVLAPGGMMGMTTPTPFAHRIIFLLSRVGLLSREEADEHKLRLSRGDLRALLAEAGFPAEGTAVRRFFFLLNTQAAARKGPGGRG